MSSQQNKNFTKYANSVLRYHGYVTPTDIAERTKWLRASRDLEKVMVYTLFNRGL